MKTLRLGGNTNLSGTQLLWTLALSPHHTPPLLESLNNAVAFPVPTEEILEVRKEKVMWEICEILGVPCPLACVMNSSSQRYPASMEGGGSGHSALEMTIARPVPREERVWQILPSLSPSHLSTQTTLGLLKASDMPQLCRPFNVYSVILLSNCLSKVLTIGFKRPVNRKSEQRHCSKTQGWNRTRYAPDMYPVVMLLRTQRRAEVACWSSQAGVWDVWAQQFYIGREWDRQEEVMEN